MIKKRALEAEQEYNKLLDKHPDVLLGYNSLNLSLRATLEPKLNNTFKQIEGIIYSYNDAISKFKNLTKGISEHEHLAQVRPNIY